MLLIKVGIHPTKPSECPPKDIFSDWKLSQADEWYLPGSGCNFHFYVNRNAIFTPFNASH
jgi:hypothetical protein